MFLAFRSIPVGRWRFTRLGVFAVFLISLIVYACTASRSVFPGLSAQWVAWVTGADVREVVTHPLLTALGGWVASLSWGTLAIRLNLLAALAGAFSVAIAFEAAQFLAYEYLRDESERKWSNLVSLIAGVVAALFAGCSIGIWEGAIQFRPEIFDTAWIFLCIHLLIVYAYHNPPISAEDLSDAEEFDQKPKWIVWMLLFGILLGAGFAESTTCMLAAPFLLILAVLVEWKISWCRFSTILGALLLALLSAAGVYLYAEYLTAGRETFSVLRAFPDSVPILREQWRELGELFNIRFWIAIAFLGYAVAIGTVSVSMKVFVNVRRWSHLLFLLILSVLEIGLLFSFSHSPDTLLMLRGRIPALIYAVAAVGFGLAVASWFSYLIMGDPDETLAANGWNPKAKEDADPEELPPSHPVIWKLTRLVGFFMFPLLCILLIFSAVSHAKWVLAEKVDFADRAARELLDDLGNRRWLISNGVIDSHIRIAAKVSGKDVILLSPFRLQEQKYLAYVSDAIQNAPELTENTKLRAKNLLEYNLHLFLEDFFIGDDKINEKAVTIGIPDLWYASTNWTPVASTFFFTGARDVRKLPIEELYQKHTDFWQKWDDFFQNQEMDERRLSTQTRKLLLHHMALLANDLGIVLDEAGYSELAFQTYEQALRILPSHVSAMLNLFELISRGVHPERKDTVERQLMEKVRDPKSRYPLWALNNYYGYVRNYELFVRMGWAWALSSSPGSVLAGMRRTYAVEADVEKRARLSAMMAAIYALKGNYAKSREEYLKALQVNPADVEALTGLSRIAIQENDAPAARAILEKGESAGADKEKLRLDWAAIAFASGDLAQARMQLEQMCMGEKPSSMALSLLAITMLEQNDYVEVEHKILPTLIKRSNGQDNYFSFVIKGKLLEKKKDNPEALQQARSCYIRALSINPGMVTLLRTILSLDMELRDRKSAIAHALTLLRLAPEDYLASFVLGTIRLEDAEYGDAERYLKIACKDEQGAKPEVLNNYAMLLCLIKKNADAERIARLAAKKDPEGYEAHSTLAYILAENGKLDEAEKEIELAWKRKDTDMRLYFTEALIAIKRSNKEQAQKALAAIGNTDQFSKSDLRILEDLRDEAKKLK
ncbi:MAG: DUF2723 domain-containing protein [Kiritimatiellae bacterium]|nr:DUF2723 domain-containing protein [Kiritimatiellia bacterium]